MGAVSSIEWTDASWTPIRARNRETGRAGWHCTHVSEGCRNCYAERRNRWIGTGLAFKPGHLRPSSRLAEPASRTAGAEPDVEIFLDEAMLLAPLRWRKPRKIFVCSMTDLFADFVPDEMIDKVFAVMALCPQHTFQVLTKRPERMRTYIASGMGGRRMMGGEIGGLAAIAGRDMDAAMDAVDRALAWPLPNVWLGTSAEDQPAADARIPDMLATPAAVRFVSLEPMLGAIDLRHYLWVGEEGGIDFSHSPRKLIDWVICGGESGPHARPMHPDWARSLRDQCAAAGVPFFFKQWGEWAPGAAFGMTRDTPIAGRRGLDADQMRRYVVRGDDTPRYRADRLVAHVFTGDPANFVYRVGKKTAGRILGGRTHDDLPEVRP